MKTRIRRFVNSDALRISEIIRRCYMEVLVNYHSVEMLEKYLKNYTEPAIIQRAMRKHVYTVISDDEIVGTGTISIDPSRNISLLEGIYIDPDFHGCGFGRKLIEYLEHDSFFTQTICTELHASGFGAPFYRHLGYNDLDALRRPDNEGLFTMFKYHLGF